jgi:hypothetical protein
MPSKDKEKNAEYFRKWYENNKELQMQRVKDQQAKLTQEVADYKESNPCKDCGNFYPACVMDFDHISDNKFKNVSSLVRRGSRKQVWEEVAKCELVCANCHRLRTAGRQKVTPPVL